MGKKQESLWPLLLSLLIILLIGADVAFGLGQGMRSVRKEAAGPTLRHFRDLWQPILTSRQRRDDWLTDGEKHLGDRLRDRTLAVIESHQPELPSYSVTQ